jgi:hypothetical protein
VDSGDQVLSKAVLLLNVMVLSETVLVLLLVLEMGKRAPACGLSTALQAEHWESLFPPKLRLSRCIPAIKSGRGE